MLIRQSTQRFLVVLTFVWIVFSLGNWDSLLTGLSSSDLETRVNFSEYRPSHDLPLFKTFRWLRMKSTPASAMTL